MTVSGILCGRERQDVEPNRTRLVSGCVKTQEHGCDQRGWLDRESSGQRGAPVRMRTTQRGRRRKWRVDAARDVLK